MGSYQAYDLSMTPGDSEGEKVQWSKPDLDSHLDLTFDDQLCSQILFYCRVGKKGEEMIINLRKNRQSHPSYIEAIPKFLAAETTTYEPERTKNPPQIADK